MKTLRFTSVLVLIALCFLYLLPAANAADRVPANYSGPVADVPLVKAGQTWTYVISDGRDYTVTMFEVSPDNKTLLTSAFPNYPDCNKCRTRMDRNGEILEVLGENGKPLREYDYAKGWKPLSFPIYVGKKWKFRADWLVGNRVVSYYSNRKVAAFERVTMPAGTFDAFRIEEYLTTSDWSGSATYWYAPEVGVVVKNTTSWPNPSGNFQLKSFTLPQ